MSDFSVWGQPPGEDVWVRKGIVEINTRTGEKRPARRFPKAPGEPAGIGTTSAKPKVSLLDQAKARAAEGVMALGDLVAKPAEMILEGVAGLAEVEKEEKARKRREAMEVEVSAIQGSPASRVQVRQVNAAPARRTPLPASPVQEAVVETRRKVRQGYDEQRDILAERLRDTPALAATADTAADLAFDVTNLIPAGALPTPRSPLRGRAAQATDLPSVRLPEPRSATVPTSAPPRAVEAVQEAMAHAESDVSPEAINRVARGERYFRLRPDGEAVPILNDVSAVDVPVGRGEAKVRVTPSGAVELEAGRLNAAQQRILARLSEPTPAATTAPPARIGPDSFELAESGDEADFLRSLGVQVSAPPARAAAPPTIPARSRAEAVLSPEDAARWTALDRRLRTLEPRSPQWEATADEMGELTAGLPDEANNFLYGEGSWKPPGFVEPYAPTTSPRDLERLRRGRSGVESDLVPEAALNDNARGRHLAVVPSRGEAGFVSTKLLESFNRWVTENFESAGPYKAAALDFADPAQRRFVGEQIPRRLEQMQGRHALAIDEKNRLLGELDKAVKAAGGDKKALWQQITAVRTGRAGLDTLPESVRDPAGRAFDFLDELGDAYAASGAAPEDLLPTLAANRGRYLHRAYAAFDDPKYGAQVEQNRPVWDAAMDRLRQEFPDHDDQQLVGMMRQMVNRDGASDLRRIASVPGGPRQLNKILQERKEIPAELRELMGEYKDFRVAFEKSVHNMAWDMETYRFFREIGDEGAALGVFRPKGDPSGQVYAKITGEGATTLGSRDPLADLLTTPGLKKALEGQFEEVRQTAWSRMAGYVKMGKTVGSIQTQFRNFISHGMTTMAQGRLPFMPAETRLTTQILRGEQLPLRRRAVELGILGEGASSKEMLDYIRMVEEGGSVVGRGIARGAKWAQKKYQVSDDFWRTYNWIGETEDLIKAKGISRPEAEALAADRVRDTVQTYGRAPLVAEKLRRNPLVGAFPTFYVESARNVANLARIGARDIAEGMRTGNKALVALGMKRYVGLTSVLASGWALKNALRQETGVTPEEEEAFRQLVAPHYQQNSGLFLHDKKPGQSYTAFDWSFINPYAGLEKPVIATQRAIEQGRAPVEAVYELLEQIAGGDILATTALEVGINQKVQQVYLPRVGGGIYHPDQPARQLGKDIGYRLYRGLAPGTVLTAENLARGAGILPQQTESGRKYELKNEALAVVGPRVTTYELEPAVKRRAVDAASRLRLLVADAKKAVDRGGNPATQAGILLDAAESVYADTLKVGRSARVLGVESNRLNDLLREGLLPRDFADAATAGQEQPPMPSFEPQSDLQGVLLQEIERQYRQRTGTDFSLWGSPATPPPATTNTPDFSVWR